ncbi:MAG: hypothetical protein HY301_03320 [Verrucomicrobia bacterium]|nr:hypothetical protein [Verrucomicrobiota bacterium]
MSFILPILISLGFTVGVGFFFWWLARRHTRIIPYRLDDSSLSGWPPESPLFADLPRAWLAIKTQDIRAVATALNLQRTTPCAWSDAVTHADDRVFISPPADGWVLVLGAGLPEPEEDVDRFFRFLLDLSRELGLVVYFSAENIFYHHAWVKANDGNVVRAYAWADQALWNQGELTQVERDLRLVCEPYREPGRRPSPRAVAAAQQNCERLADLAARWALDPRAMDTRTAARRPGLAGEFKHPKLH